MCPTPILKQAETMCENPGVGDIEWIPAAGMVKLIEFIIYNY